MVKRFKALLVQQHIGDFATWIGYGYATAATCWLVGYTFAVVRRAGTVVVAD